MAGCSCHAVRPENGSTQCDEIVIMIILSTLNIIDSILFFCRKDFFGLPLGMECNTENPRLKVAEEEEATKKIPESRVSSVRTPLNLGKGNSLCLYSPPNCYMGVSENQGHLILGSIQRDPTVLGAISGSPIFGNSPMGFLETLSGLKTPWPPLAGEHRRGAQGSLCDRALQCTTACDHA